MKSRPLLRLKAADMVVTMYYIDMYYSGSCVYTLYIYVDNNQD